MKERTKKYEKMEHHIEQGSHKMKALILAGGKGTRLKEVIKDIPKPMAPVAGRPFLEYLIMQLLNWDIRDIVISTGYREEIITSYFGDGKTLGANISYSIEDKPLGTGGAIKKAARLIDDETFIAMNGDSFLDLNFRDFISFSQNKGALAALTLPYVSNTERYGRVESDSSGTVTGFSEKGQSGPGTINGGIYIFSRTVTEMIPDGNISVENDVFPRLANKGLYGMRMEGFFIDIGIPEDYLKLNNRPELLRSAQISNNIYHE